MVAITIPKEITQGEELIVIPKKLYEQFLRVLKKNSSSMVISRLDSGLEEALEDVKVGRVIGPFSSLKEGLAALKHAK